MPTIAKYLLCCAALLLFVATGLGAYASHGMQGLSPQALAAVHTAIDYQFWHSLGLAGVALLIDRFPAGRGLRLAGWLLVAGIVLFSGSIFADRLAGFELLGQLAPTGGLCLMAGWLALAWSALRLGTRVGGR
jgi:uncharacterized membrane protein YgdD (TMEM256/DUF423 family)